MLSGGSNKDDQDQMLDGVERSDHALPDPARLPPPKKAGSAKTMGEDERIKKFLGGVKVSPEMGACLDSARPILVQVIRGIRFVIPYYKKFYMQAYDIYKQLPHNAITMVFGVALCFFGGTYVASIAAIEAFRQLGWQKVQSELKIVYGQMQLVVEASDKDDELDEDGDGVADVDQINATELTQRKMVVAMKAISEPERLQTAFGALFVAYLSVLATLRLEFARTTAFALGIVEMAKFPIVRTLGPILAATFPEDIRHWTQTIVETSLTFLAVMLAWWLQMIISAFYSGLRGGKMFADGLIALLVEKDLMDKVPLIHQPFDPDDSYLDEAVGYGLAAVGFGFQFLNGFSLPFPLNLVFLPLTIIEWFLRLQISMEGSAALAV
jgi:hypothetical protein